ncbi:MAG: hypothetical protein JNK64_06465 [Myxococcales bacterium]|nr:hypothetical protein [Myxococcales bacterium]
MRAWIALALMLATACGSDRDRPPPAPPPPPAPASPRAAPIDAGPVEATAPTDVASTGCPDPHVGLWVGRSFEDGHWNEFRIELRQVAGALTCFEETRWWDGPEDALRPPACPRGGPAWGITQLRCEARATADGLEVRTVTILSDRHTCDGPTGGYIHDWFRGPLTGNTWGARNRYQDADGAWVELTATFHRLSCTP